MYCITLQAEMPVPVKRKTKWQRELILKGVEIHVCSKSNNKTKKIPRDNLTGVNYMGFQATFCKARNPVCVMQTCGQLLLDLTTLLWSVSHSPA